MDLALPREQQAHTEGLDEVLRCTIVCIYSYAYA